MVDVPSIGQNLTPRTLQVPLQQHSSQSMSLPAVENILTFPSMPPPGIFTPAVFSPIDALRAQKSAISVAGQTFRLSSPHEAVFRQSLLFASSFHQLFHVPNRLNKPAILDLALHFRVVQTLFAPDAFETAALAFVNDFDWTDEILSRDGDLLRSLGSLDLVLAHHSARNRLAGMNPTRLLQWLPSDPRLPLLLTMATTGGEVDTDPDFAPFRHTGPLRPLQQRLLPVYRYHAHKMWRAGKGLLLRLSDIPPATLETMHTGNSCHLVPKPDTPEGRFIIDASNVSEGRILLNGKTTKDQAILRYGAVLLPNIRGVLTRWDEYRRRWHLSWSDLKEDIKSCFNHLRWSTRFSRLLATMVDSEVVFVMLTGGFGHASTPMQWDVVGGAILRRVEAGCASADISSASSCDVGRLKSPVDMYVDDTFGAGRADHVQQARDRVVLVSEGVLAPGTAISTEKSILASATDILGYHVDCSTATIRPKDRAIDRQALLCAF